MHHMQDQRPYAPDRDRRCIFDAAFVSAAAVDNAGAFLGAAISVVVVLDESVAGWEGDISIK